MKKRINHTGRRRITRDCVKVLLVDGAGGAPSFEAALRLEPGAFPEDASVYVEAYQAKAYQRFPWGSVGQPGARAGNRLTDMDGPDGIKFRVKVVDETDEHGRLLGVADKLRPEQEEERGEDSLLFMRTSDQLGERVWALEFDGSQPILTLNSRLPDAHDLVRQPRFISLVLPEVFRQVLLRAFLVDAAYTEEVADEPTAKWLRFAERVKGDLPSQPADNDLQEVGEVFRWLDDAVRQFAETKEFCTVYLDDTLERED